MTQAKRTESFAWVRVAIETSIQERLYSEMVIGGLLEMVKPEEFYMLRKFDVSDLDAPSIFVTRAPQRSAMIGGHSDVVSMEYQFVPLVESFDFMEAEQDALTIADNVADAFISKGDRSLGGLIYDIKHIETSATFPFPESDKIFFSVARLEFQYMKRTK